MKVERVDLFVVGRGRPWLFTAVRTDDGITGYGEFGTGEFPRGLPGLVEDLAQNFVIGQDPGPVDKLALDMYRATRGASYGATQMAIAGLELAMWDIKGKALGVPVHTLFGGPFRNTQRVYYSHLGTYRARAAERMGVAPLRTMQDVADCAVEAVELGYTAFKTNLIFPGDPATVIAQGFRGPVHDQTATTALIRHAERQIGAMRDAVGPDIDILLDINFNFKPNEAIRLARALEPYDLYWLEIDNQAPAALAALRNAAPMPITSGEQLQTPRQYHPYFQAGAMDVAMIDVQYQGFGASKKTADLAETYEINIAPHNFNSHLATYQSLNLTAASSNVRIMESDVDSMPWRDEIITRIPEVVNGEMTVPSAPGWGADLDEDAARRNAWTA